MQWQWHNFRLLFRLVNVKDGVIVYMGKAAAYNILRRKRKIFFCQKQSSDLQ